MTEKQKFLKEHAEVLGYLTTWSWNDSFLLFWEKFYPGEISGKKVTANYRLTANSLVKLGIVEKCRRTGVGLGCASGSKTQSIWNAPGAKPNGTDELYLKYPGISQDKRPCLK